MNELIKINQENQISARELYEFLELDVSHFSRWIKQNIEDNQFAEKNIDYRVLAIQGENPLGGRPSTDYMLTIDFAKKLCMVSKSERGEQARNYFIEVEKKLKHAELQLESLSPELQLLIKMELKQKELENNQKELETQIKATTKEVQSIKEIESLRPANWRKETTSILNKIVHSSGMDYRELRAFSYQLLNERFAVNLKARLLNKRGRMVEEGASLTKINETNYLDIIDEDKKLIEGYIAIIKELAIKYS